MANENRGFAGMDEEEQRRIASEGGKASGGNFANDPQRASEAGRKGAEAQPVEAKREGGQHSRSGQQTNR
jgi:general stress protein YciG